MAQHPDTIAESIPQETMELKLAHRWRLGIARLRCRVGPLGKQMTRLGRWLEEDIFPEARKEGDEALFLGLSHDGVIRLEQEPPSDPAAVLNCCRELCLLLGNMGISHLRVDTRLESNQIEDILTLMYAFRRRLAKRCKDSLASEIDEKPHASKLHFNCMQVHLQGDLLIVEYSHCVTRMSLAIRWFKRRHHRFADHRTLFHAGPRYGLLAAALTMGVLSGYLLTDSVVFLLVATVVEAVILFAAVYIFMLGMGSIEYDYEEGAYQLARAHASLTRYSDRIRHDLALARTVQRKLLPNKMQMPLSDRLEWVTSFSPETEVGGDYFDVASFGDNKAAIVFADVSGHGMAAALITVIVKMAFQSWIDARWPLEEFIRVVNRDLCRFTPHESFVALMAGVYDDVGGRLDFVNSGHAPEPFYLPSDPSSPVRRLMETGSMVLGVEEDIPIHRTSLLLTDGDTIVLATDGLPEALNSRKEMYGNDRLAKALDEYRSGTMDCLVASVIEDIAHFSENTEQGDDQTILAFRVRGQQKQQQQKNAACNGKYVPDADNDESLAGEHCPAKRQDDQETMR